MKAKVFNNLTANEKWDALWNKRIKLDGTWHCKHCDEQDDNVPYRASPFSGCSVHCGNCKEELTRRTGGGQSDPFNWILKNRK